MKNALFISFNFIFPPVGGLIAAKKAHGKFQDDIYLSANRGSWMGAAIGILLVSVLLAMAFFGPLNILLASLVIALPIFIGIPWLCSVLGKAIGFAYKLAHTSHFKNASKVKIFFAALKFMFTNQISIGQLFSTFYVNGKSSLTVTQIEALENLNQRDSLSKTKRSLNLHNVLFSRPDIDQLLLVFNLLCHQGFDFKHTYFWEKQFLHNHTNIDYANWLPLIKILVSRKVLLTEENLEVLFEIIRYKLVDSSISVDKLCHIFQSWNDNLNNEFSFLLHLSSDVRERLFRDEKFRESFLKRLSALNDSKVSRNDFEGISTAFPDQAEPLKEILIVLNRHNILNKYNKVFFLENLSLIKPIASAIKFLKKTEWMEDYFRSLKEFEWIVLRHARPRDTLIEGMAILSDLLGSELEKLSSFSKSERFKEFIDLFAAMRQAASSTSDSDTNDEFISSYFDKLLELEPKLCSEVCIFLSSLLRSNPSLSTQKNLKLLYENLTYFSTIKEIFELIHSLNPSPANSPKFIKMVPVILGSCDKGIHILERLKKVQETTSSLTFSQLESIILPPEEQMDALCMGVLKGNEQSPMRFFAKQGGDPDPLAGQKILGIVKKCLVADEKTDTHLFNLVNGFLESPKKEIKEDKESVQPSSAESSGDREYLSPSPSPSPIPST